MLRVSGEDGLSRSRICNCVQGIQGITVETTFIAPPIVFGDKVEAGFFELFSFRWQSHPTIEYGNGEIEEGSIFLVKESGQIALYQDFIDNLDCEPGVVNESAVPVPYDMLVLHLQLGICRARSGTDS